MTIEVLPYQQPPPGDWTGWLMLAGRGTGKSWAGAYWIHTTLKTMPKARARIISPWESTGINSSVDAVLEIAYSMGDEVKFRPTAPGGARLEWPNGALCWIISTPAPRDVDKLRGTGNVHLDWFEEAAANPHLEKAWLQSVLSRRKGDHPRWMASTTPRPLRRIKDWLADPQVVVTRASIQDNKFLPPTFMEEIRRAIPEGSRMWRQEVLGEVIDDFLGALWSIDGIDKTRIPEGGLPQMLKVVVGVDPATGPGLTGIVVVGQGADKDLYVLGDYSTIGRPEEWAAVVAEAAAEYGARVVAEVNQGGTMVKSVLESAGLTTPVDTVRASEGKRARAEPVSLLWQSGRAHIVGSLPALEDAMSTWIPGDETPIGMDRIDAMVWAASSLLGQNYPMARIFRPQFGLMDEVAV